jgi:hypothetical protein
MRGHLERSASLKKRGNSSRPRSSSSSPYERPKRPNQRPLEQEYNAIKKDEAFSSTDSDDGQNKQVLLY